MAEEWFTKAAAQGDEEAQEALRIMPFDPTAADIPSRHLVDAAERGNSDAQYLLANPHRSGEHGTERDTQRARELLKASAAQGSRDAASALTSMRACAACGTPRPRYMCQRCKEVKYCNTECQRKHWTEGPEPHKAHCIRKHVPPPPAV